MERDTPRIGQNSMFKIPNIAIYLILGIQVILNISTASSSVIDEGSIIANDTNLLTNLHVVDKRQEEGEILKQNGDLKTTERLKELEIKFDQAISKLKLANVNQNENIAILKAGKRNQNQRIIALESEISQLKSQNFNQTIQIGKLEKMVQDHHKTLSDNGILDANNKPKNVLKITSNKLSENAATSSAAILPTSCNNLLTDGHRLNGIYLLYDPDFKKIIPTFCDFQNGGVGSKKLGILSTKSSTGVFFYVQRSLMADDNAPKVVIFNVLRLNIGGAMNLSKGLFTVPTSGIYQFSFSIIREGYATGEMHVHLRVNGVKIGNGVSNAGFYAGLSSFQSIIALKKGDRVDLYKSQARINYDVANCCHFTGMLLEEDLKEF